MFWVCLIESNVISFWIVIYLAAKGRKSAAIDGLVTIGIGWAIKAILLLLVMKWSTST